MLIQMTQMNDKKISSAFSAAETKKATIRLLRTIVVLTQTLKSLPDDVIMSMKLLYFDDVTPAEYEPPGFQSCDVDGFRFDEEPMNIKVGDVNTPFHTVKLRIKTDGKQFEMQDEQSEQTKDVGEKTEPANQDVVVETIAQQPPEPSVGAEPTLGNSPEEGPSPVSGSPMDQDNEQQVPSITPEGKKIVKLGDTKLSQRRATPARADSGLHTSAQLPGSTDQAVDTTGSQDYNEDLTEDLGVQCPCGCNEDDGLMILCAVCHYWQHGVCFLITLEEDAPERHICNSCADPNDADLQPTDIKLSGLSSLGVQAMCLWRRALMACTEMSRVLQPSFARRLGVEMTVATGLLNRLEKEGFIKNPTKGKRLGKIVNRDKILKEGLPKYFNKSSVNQQRVEPEAQPEPENQQTIKKGNTNEKSKGKATVDDIVSLATRTEGITLSGHKKKSTKEILQDEQQHQVTEKGDGPEKKSAGKRKRTVSTIEGEEFEISNSQSQDMSPTKRGRKRRKASITSKAIIV
ncbi:unnamed protein product [Owenia fusiformis]|uniref:Uncharacterized protein n=1 Tax=Owenia fusiformis TaxID=6347 RepID=A0A8J1TZF8_OWEFU|nr:unnamed protein product [Owenia fusiformis]